MKKLKVIVSGGGTGGHIFPAIAIAKSLEKKVEDIELLFVGAKVSQYALLPQGQVEAADRVRNMVAQMDLEGFGNCTNTGACEVECPKGISLDNIARMNRELMKASI